MVFEEVRDIICEQLGIDKENVNLETSFEEIDADSLDLFQIVIEIEEKYNIQIENVELLNSVQDLVKYIEENKK